MNGSEVAHALFDAVEARDFDRVAALFEPDALVWHNFDARELPISEALAMVARVVGFMRVCRYEQRRYQPVPGGAFCQHVFNGTTQDGSSGKVHLMLHLQIEGGRIRRIEEYLDPAELRALVPSMQLNSHDGG